MHVSHDPVIVAESGNTDILCSTQIEGTELANGIAIADFKTRWLSGVFLVLRHLTKRAELKNPVIASDAGMPGNNNMRPDRRVVTDFDMLSEN
jgi:hypothetical protein